MFAHGSLDRVHLPLWGETFNGGDLLALCVGCQDEAGADRRPIQENSAGAAGPPIAYKLGACQGVLEANPKRIKQRGPGLHHDLTIFPIHPEGERGFASTDLSGVGLRLGPNHERASCCSTCPLQEPSPADLNPILSVCLCSARSSLSSHAPISHSCEAEARIPHSMTMNVDKASTPWVTETEAMRPRTARQANRGQLATARRVLLKGHD